MAAVTATVISTAIAVAGTAYSISESERAKSEAKREAKKREAKEKTLMDEAKNKNIEAEANKARDEAKNRVRALTAGGTAGRQGTILTSPLGVSGNAQTAGKTLLGA